MRAVEEVLGPVEVDIENAINQGLYTEIKMQPAVTSKDVRNIQKVMERIVKDDLPFVAA